MSSRERINVSSDAPATDTLGKFGYGSSRYNVSLRMWREEIKIIDFASCLVLPIGQTYSQTLRSEEAHQAFRFSVDSQCSTISNLIDFSQMKSCHVFNNQRLDWVNSGRWLLSIDDDWWHSSYHDWNKEHAPSLCDTLTSRKTRFGRSWVGLIRWWWSELCSATTTKLLHRDRHIRTFIERNKQFYLNLLESKPLRLDSVDFHRCPPHPHRLRISFQSRQPRVLVIFHDSTWKRLLTAFFLRFWRRSAKSISLGNRKWDCLCSVRRTIDECS